MKTSTRTYTPPPDAIYRAGKRKERVSKAISLLESLKEDLANNPSVLKTIAFLKEYRAELEIL